MGCCKKFLLVSVVLLAATGLYIHHKLTAIPEMPEIEVDRWWGPGAPKKVDNSIRPFKVQFTDEMITDLKSRLSSTSTVTPLEGVSFEYGFNINYLKEVIQFWTKDYNFKEREAFLNKYPHFKTNIQGLDVHFMHIKPKVSKNIKVLPLLLVHGWPGSIREFYEIIPLLTTPRKDRDFVFELVVPSLPGYGFSQAAAKPGFGADHIAVVFRNLMQRLGYSKYYVHGGDWGALITQIISIYFPKEVLALHTNAAFVRTDLSTLRWLLGSIHSSCVVADEYRDRMYPVTEKFQFLLEEMGYSHLQATKPDTIGVVLSNSPAGLAAYILEKFSTWTNPAFKTLPDGGLTKKYTLTNLLDNVMIYWSTNSITTSMRLYSEVMNKRFEALNIGRLPILVPSAVANFKHELMYMSEYIIKEKFVNLVHMSHFDDGGHFAAFELPQLMADDIWLAITKIRNLESDKDKSKSEL